MDIIRTSLGVAKTFKNVVRLREILTVFARNGFDELIIATNLHTKIPGFVLPSKRIEKALDEKTGEEDLWGNIGFRLRKSFEELGPSFIKLGQLMATREDLLPAEIISELKLLQNKVKPIPYKEALKIIEKNLGTSVDEVFTEIEPKAIGAASIGCAYRGVLKNGKEVVIKVRRPGIEKLIETDFRIVHILITQIEKNSEDLRYLGVSRAIDDFQKSIQVELNFLVEAMNAERMEKNLKASPSHNLYVIPKVYRQYCTREILVMDYLDGKPFNELGKEGLPASFEKNVKICVKDFLTSLLSKGFFHADLHGGNFFLMPNQKIGIIDFGLMGTLGKKNRHALIAILFAMTSGDYENLAFEFLDVAEYEDVPNHEDLVRDITDCLIPFVGLSANEINITEMVRAIVHTLSKHRIYLPREWFIIFRALMTLDGVGKSLGLQINVFEILSENIQELVQEVFSKENMLQEATWLGRDLISGLRILPRHLKWFLREAAQKNYALDLRVKGLETEIHHLNSGIYFLGISIFCAILIFCGSLFIKDLSISHPRDIPVITYLFWGCGLAGIFRAGWIRYK